jgi:DNA integrity scanning protein DisA with diadenylate cyclase activity
MGSNRWPIDICSSVLDDLERFYTAARDVALSRDGAVVLTVDGTVLEQMVRFKDLTAGDDVAEEQRDMEYADWMGSRHMSAFDTSLRRSVVATITVSEETGRVTVFQSGEYDTLERDELGGPWRTES